MRNWHTLTMIVIVALGATAYEDALGQPLSAISPDGTLAVTVTNEDGRLHYSLSRFGRIILAKSRLGLELREGSLAESIVATDTTTKTVAQEWEQVWGERRWVTDRHTELRVNVSAVGQPPLRMTVVFRVFDDGIGFRYEIPELPDLAQFMILDELSEFALTEDPTAWWIGAYQWNRYEYLYEESPLSEAADTLHTPLTMETRNGLFLGIHEAALVDYASMTLARTSNNVLKADLVPWSDGVKVRASTPMVTPWRTIQVADNAGDLISSNLILNLNEPNRIEDTSWIRPGKYVGIWWEMHLGVSTWGPGPNHGATTINTTRYIDFAADYGFDGVLVEGWNRGWEGDWINGGSRFRFTEPYDDFDIDFLAKYALERGTRLIGHHETAGAVMNYEAQMDDAFAFYQDRGVRAVKTGYVAFDRQIERLDDDGEIQLETHHGQYMVNHYNRVVETAARHQIMINAHEPIKPTGLRRTYPNLMSQEGARGQEYNSPEGGGNTPEHTAVIPFTRMLAGPMDFTPGIFQLVAAEDEPENNVPTTLAKQLALYVVIYSPLHMAADLPHNYLEQPEAFTFIRDVPTNWQDTRVMHSEIGDYVTVVRKDWGSEDWFLGSITDEEGRVLRTSLGFLTPNTHYVADVYRDAADADWESNPLGFVTSRAIVDSNTTVTLRLAPGGGAAIRLRPVDAVPSGVSRCDGDRRCGPEFVPLVD